MAFDSFQDFLAMGGHAPYVWASWGVTGALLVGIVLHARAERRQLLRRLQRHERRRTTTDQTSHQTGGQRHEA
ncbi:MAG: heme exporter protein CcmD [Halomonas sp.]|uniref:heme exporter protein CcmD n=1 Tax=Halomonas TaxID=2745 RepID=UPI000481DC47|nr:MULTISPECIES: heme exporter protein CcmD [Halomonas]NWN81638.1 heme exporter protein CcmD [Halomonas sp.]